MNSIGDGEEDAIGHKKEKSEEESQEAFKESIWKNAKSTEELIANTFGPSAAHPGGGGRVEWVTHNGYIEDYPPPPPPAGLPEINDEIPFRECELGISEFCGTNEVCYQVLPKSRQGICTCVYGFTRDEENNCVPRYAAAGDLMDIPAPPPPLRLPNILNPLPPPAITQSSSITVSVASKDVRLPEKEAVLSAYTIPEPTTDGDKYEYAWSLISQPTSSNGTISDQTKDRILLSNLSEGVYRFRVLVTGAHGSHGEAEANLTVLPEQRALKPPQVTINPQSQTLRLPNSQAILDGSSEASSPESEIVNWHWTLSSGPIGYQTDLPETNILQLTDLRVPGNYTFKLTVTDSNGAQNSSTAEIYVLKGTDYPPEANAVPNVMIRLPHNSIVLNGSQSTDDRGIVSWEWIKDLSDTTSGAGAVDMQDTRTPFLKLSNLEEGTYRFILKVTDASGQSSNTSVMVFVKPPLTSTPTANAGADQVRRRLQRMP